MISKGNLVKITDYLWKIPKNYRPDMLVPARIYATEKMLEEIFRDKSLEQLVNLTTLPGIYKYALVMPDAHEGYGSPIGGVAATSIAAGGIISPGMCGYDINCGVRLLRSEKTYDEVKNYLEDLGTAIFEEVPSGVGRGGRLRLTDQELDKVFVNGAKRLVEMGYGNEKDLDSLEAEGRLDSVLPDQISQRARSRGRDQLGTMGAGNHFVEVQRVDEIFDNLEAERLGLFENQITIMIHTGSRGLGHQVATDFIRVMLKAMPKYKIELPDRELTCAPFESKEGQEYFGAMSGAANFAWANRQLITWEVRKAWEDTLEDTGGKLEIVYDVAHNIVKVEEYEGKKLVVHRKGATRSFPGQPVLIPGSMGTSSYVLVGQEKAMKESFGSSCHGAGRRMSRHAAKRQTRGSILKEELERAGIVIRTGSIPGLAEEAPQAYKDVEEVVDVVHQAGLAQKVARLKPIAVIKG